MEAQELFAVDVMVVAIWCTATPIKKATWLDLLGTWPQLAWAKLALTLIAEPVQANFSLVRCLWGTYRITKMFFYNIFIGKTKTSSVQCLH